jgi:hypothetical protein
MVTTLACRPGSTVMSILKSCHRGLAQARRPVQQDVLHGLVALAHGLEGDGQPLDEIALADVLVQPPRAQRRAGRRRPRLLAGLGLAVDDASSGHG